MEERSQGLAICILWGECWSFYSKEKFLIVCSWILITVLRLAVRLLSRIIYAAKDLRDRLCDTDIYKRALLTSFFYLTPFSGMTGGPSPFCAPWAICHKMKCPMSLNCWTNYTTNWKSAIATYLKESPKILTCEAPMNPQPFTETDIYIHVVTKISMFYLLKDLSCLISIRSSWTLGLLSLAFLALKNKWRKISALKLLLTQSGLQLHPLRRFHC